MLKTSREKVVKNAEKYISRGKIEAGIKEYRKLLDENPNDISTLNRVGDLYARIQRNSEAIELFHRIAEQYADDGFLVKAIAIYKKIIKLDPTQLEIYEQLADLYHRQGLVNEARTQYQVLADYYLKHDKPASAVSVYERMVELEPDNPSHRVKLAELYQEQDLVDKALGEYRAIAEMMLEHGKGAEAAQVYERGLAVSAEDIGFITDGVLKLKEAGHVGAAAKLLSLAVERNPQAERVARVAGLGEASRAEEAADEVARDEAPGAERDEAPQDTEDELDLDAYELEADEPEVDTRELEEPAAADRESAPAEAPVAEEAPEGLMGEESGFGELEIDLPDDDDEPESMVRPPADMLEDRERPGAAWGMAEAAADEVAAEFAAQQEAAEEEEDDSGAADAPAAEEPAEGTFEFELDLDADGEELLDLAADEAEAAEEPVAAVPAPGDDGTGIDHDLLERTAAEVHAQPESGPEDLFTEAEVLARYGIHEKALERLADLLHRSPRHLEGYQLMVGIHLDGGRHGRAASVAGRLAEVAEEVGDETIWPELRDRLEAAGYRIDGLRVQPPEGFEPEPASEIDSELAAEAAAGDGGPPVAEEAAPEEVPGPMDAEAAAEEGAIEVELDEDRFDLPEVPAPGEEVAAETAPPDRDEAEDRPDEDLPEPDAPPAAAAPTARRRPGANVDAALEELTSGLLGRKTRRPGAGAARPVDAAPSPEVQPPGPPAPAEHPELAELAEPAEPAAQEAAPPPAEPAAPPTPAEPGGVVDPLRALGDSLREEIDVGADEGDAAAEAPGATSPPPPAAAPEEAPAVDAQDPDDSAMSWLDEVSESSEGESLFAGEEDFFDLGAELEEELTSDGSFGGEDDLLLSNSEQSLEDIVEGFKRGVAENLSSEDYDTHFNLGIAYREMGLLDEAIGEFQLAAKHPEYLVTCASMLGLCFLEKGLPELAVKWYQRGLEAPEIEEEDRLGLLYDLGNAQAAAGDADTAYHTFVDLYGINTNYRDVVARLAELEPRAEQ